MSVSRLGIPYLGFGLGLRRPHTAHILAEKPAVDWFEVISENYMDIHGKPRRILQDVRAHYPVVMHGVSLSIGTIDPPNSEYLKKLRALMDWLKPAWLSDHLCWTGVAHKNLHDLLPVPYTEESLRHLVDRVKHVQDFLSRPLCLENPSTYLEFAGSTIPEAEFIARLAEEADCGLLLDVNNVYVTCFNHRLDAQKYLDTLPLDRVAQIHLAGHSNKGTHIVDTHDAAVIDDVWDLYRYTIARAGRLNTMVEWDSKIPEFPVLYAELEKARAVSAEAARPDALRHPLPQLAADLPPVRPNAPVDYVTGEEWMQRAILAGDVAAAEPDGWIRPKPDFPPAKQLDVYVQAYRIRLREVTEGDFPILKHYLGAAQFDRQLRAYVEATPSPFFDAGRYPTGFPDFLRLHIPDDIAAHEIAALECAIGQLAYAEDSAALATENLNGLTPEAMMAMALPLRAGAVLLAFSHDIPAYYRAVKNTPEATAPPEMRESWVAVYRHAETSWRLTLDKNEFRILQHLQREKPVGEALAAIVDAQTDIDALGASLSRWFGRWMENGLLASPQSHPQRSAA